MDGYNYNNVNFAAWIDVERLACQYNIGQCSVKQTGR